MQEHSLKDLAPKRRQPVIAGVSSSTLVGLKAQVQRAKQGTADAPSVGELHTKLPKALQYSIKNKRSKNAGVAQRAAADVATAKTESEQLAASQAALEKKSRIYDAIARGDESPGSDCDVDFSTRMNSSTAHRETQGDRRSPSPQYGSDDNSPQPARRSSPTYEPFREGCQSAERIEHSSDLHGTYHEDVRAAEMSAQERALLDRKHQHHEAFEARRERLEAEEELSRQRNSIIKEQVAHVQQEVAAERAAGSSQKRSNPVDSSRRKALLEKLVAKRMRKQ